jgi:FkbM family methyltransferase
MRGKKIILDLASFVAKIFPDSLIRYVYRNPALSKNIRGVLNRAAPIGYNRVEIAAGSNMGLEMFLDLKTEKEYWLGTYELDLQKAVQAVVAADQIIYDIGANIGYLTLMFARILGPGGQVFAFEALPENIGRLKENIELNGFQDRVTVVNAAVTDHSGEVEFLIGPSSAMGKVQGSSGRNSFDYQDRILIEGISIDEYVEKSGIPSPNIIKLDIEGGEVLALNGMDELLINKKPILFIELHGLESAEMCWEILQMANYRICLMKDDFPQVNSIDELDWKSYLLAFPNVN